MSVFNRRSILRGALGGAAVCVGVPTLDLFLDGHGKAYADGARLPVRFGTFFFGLGLTPTVDGGSRWVPKETGDAQWTVTPQLQSLKGIEHKVSVFSDFKVFQDGKPNHQHFTGNCAIMTGVAAAVINVYEAPTFDTTVAQAIGNGTRFRQVDVAPYGTPRSLSARAAGSATSTADVSPLQLYTRLFGEGYQDPNSATFTPDPQVMLRQSVLSAVTDQRNALMASVGASDKQALDQYFTSVRSMENQLSVELQKPARAESCAVPAKPDDTPRSRDISIVNQNNKMMAQLMAMGLACNQTKVFTVLHSEASSGLFLPGDPDIYHQHTHEEPIDPQVGYQPISERIGGMTVEAYADFVRALDSVREGDGTLLDNTLFMGYSDVGYARVHALENIPMFLAGGAGGAHKAGKHIKGVGDPVTRVSLTAQQLLGLPVGAFGTGSQATTKPISEVMKA